MVGDKRDEGHHSSTISSSKKRRGNNRGLSAGEGSGDDDRTKELEEPARFVLCGDDTGRGIDYGIMNKGSWKTLEQYCEKWGIKQAHLDSIYARFERTIIRTEHLDFTSKPQFHASLDFLADQFMATSGEFAAQLFIQTWFLRHERGLLPPKDRRCVDFARLVIMCCDLARMGDYELLATLWGCVLHRFSLGLPSGPLNLKTRLNTELVKETIVVMHVHYDKQLDLLLEELIAQAENLKTTRSDAVAQDTTGAARVGEREQETGGAQRREQDKTENRDRKPRYLTLEQVLRFCFQYPPLMLPVVHFQRDLRFKIIGAKYWLRRRKPAGERGVDLTSLLGLPQGYNDLFDRIDHRRDAWVVATGHLLIRALDPMGVSKDFRDKGEGLGEGDCDRRYEQLLTNCLPPIWYNPDTTNPSTPPEGKILSPSALSGSGSVAAVTTVPTLAVMAGRVGASSAGAFNIAAAKTASTLRSRISQKIKPSGAKSPEIEVREEDNTDEVTRRMLPPASDIPASQPEKDKDAHLRGGASAEDHGPPVDLENRHNAEALHPPAAGTDLLTPLDWPALGRKYQPSNSINCEADTLNRTRREPKRRISCKLPCSPHDAAAMSARRTANDIAKDGRQKGVDMSRKLCAFCLERRSRGALCRFCRGRAVTAFKDRKGSRKARGILVSYGSIFGIKLLTALEEEAGAEKRWVRIYDDDTGCHFFYNVHFDSAVWEGNIQLPFQAASKGRSYRPRRTGEGTTRGAAGSALKLHSSPVSPGLSARSGLTSPATPVGQHSPDRATTNPGNRVVVLAAGEEHNGSVPEVLEEAHKRLHPLFLLIRREDPDVATAAALDGTETEDKGGRGDTRTGRSTAG